LIGYFDTSSFIKLYVGEEGSSGVKEFLASVDTPASSSILMVEMRGALARMLASSRIDSDEYGNAVARFETDWEIAIKIPVTASVLSMAASMAERRLLRALDAVHLASAMTLGRQQEEELILSSWDKPLLDAAAAEGVRVISVP